MSLSILGGFFETAPEFKRLLSALKQDRVSLRVQVLPEGAPASLATLRARLGAPMIVVTPRPEDARRLAEQAALWSADEGAVLHYLETETLPFERLVTDPYTTQQRLRALYALTGPAAAATMVIASTSAVVQKTVDRKTFESNTHTVRAGQRLEMDETLAHWRAMGYKVEPAVDAPGLVSRRGGIIDIFPVNSDWPARIELWGDEVDSIRLFDPATQLSREVVKAIDIVPARETLPGLIDREHMDRLLSRIDVSNCTGEARDRISEEIDLLLNGSDIDDPHFYGGLFNLGSILDYIPDSAVLVLFRPSDIVSAAWDLEERTHDLREVKEQRGELPHLFPSSHMGWKDVDDKMRGIGRRVDITPWGAEELTQQDAFTLPLASAPEFFGNLAGFADDVSGMISDGHRVVCMSSVPKRLVEILEEHGIKAENPARLKKMPEPSTITILQATGAGLSNGWVAAVSGRKLVVLSDAEIFGVAKHRRASRRKTMRRDTLLNELHPGDYIVHVEHGIGKFMGTGRNPRDEGDREYLILQYAEGDKLFVPMEHLDRVTPYVAPMDKAPSLTRLGTQEWKKTREKVERSTREMAAELLTLYASRELTEGRPSGPDTPWQVQLEDSFPYEETADQVRTLEEVKEDLEAPKPMDRLVCGDVGYGKTEIALRAAFKTVMGGRQVAILVPTTVLAQQHFNTFSERLKAFPVRVEMISRFRSEQEQKEIIEKLPKGEIDILIGTHRLIQKDIKFKDLGLVVIDEEQRFGVVHKERLKQMRNEVDVLTLTATPIPRTLHLSLAGIRDMSTIMSPPDERLPIKTYVSEFSDELIREVVRRELDRQGQVFFLHNRVYNIEYMAEYINKLVPEARVGIGHGQMGEDQLEKVMLAFGNGELDVLVCTTIIESGLDIPNANTLIIDRADTFGLAQLYQLRGRIGRSSRRAYAYLLIPPAKSITETAEKRLKTMLAATELGAGFQIAMKDLEIRGAGNILGADQSGHIHAVGFDLYTRLLSDAVEELRAQRAAQKANGAKPQEAAPQHKDDAKPASVELGIPANIPPSYIEDMPIRLNIYKRMVSATSLEEITKIESELQDRFGPLPFQVENLMYVVRLKIKAGQCGVESISREPKHIVIKLRGDTGGAKQALKRMLGPNADVGNTQIRLDLTAMPDGWERPLADAVDRMLNLKEQMSAQFARAVPG
ncbi:MAG: transcription-repair coupling factor [SAR202 cluster bacterium]|nr:transcription-repair coupling factor [SAR202 cluster bacterium]